MTNNHFSREELLNIIETDHVQCGEASALARMALAAMDSEPNRNPVLAYADSYRDMAKQGVESVPIWSVITDLERNIAPLYRHAQPVVPDDVQRDAKRWRALLGSARIRILGSAGFDATAHPGENPDYRHFGMEIWTHYPNWLHEKNEYGIDTLTQYADAMLAAAPQPQNEPQNIPEIIPQWIPVSERMPENDVSVLTFDGMYRRVHHAMYGHWQCWEPEKITHWMPLPAAPQNAKP